MHQGRDDIVSIASAVLEKLDIEAVLPRVLDAACELTGARYAALGILDERGTQLERFLTRGIDAEARQRIGPLPTGRGVLGELIRDPRPLRLADVGSHPYSYGFPVGHPPMRSFLGVPVAVDGKRYGNLYLTEKEGEAEFTEADEQAVVMLARFAGLAIDHARQYSHAEAQRRQLQQSMHALDATIQISRALAGQTDLDTILTLVSKRGRALVSARALVIELLEDDELAVAAGAGELPPNLLGRRTALAQTVASVALSSRTTQRLSDELNRARFEQHGLGSLGVIAANGLLVPLVFRGRPWGLLVALDHLGDGDFTAEQQRLLEAFATSAAAAVATARTIADDRRHQRVAAAEAERARWARELHDETLQALANLRLALSSARRSGEPGAIETAVDRALEELDLDITSLRALITELRPAALDQLGLEPALLALADRTRHTGVSVDADVQLAHGHGEAAERLAPELEIGIYRIVQEALTNAIKHGSASAVTLSVIERGERVVVRVSDNGVGFQPAASTAGFGLIGMRERSELLSGTLEISSTSGEGTTITAEFAAVRAQAGSTPTQTLAGGA